VRIRFQADADLNQTIVLATVRREPGIDFQSAVQADLEGLKDPEVLALAANSGRLLVTHDIKTMPGHFAKFIQRATSPGVSWFLNTCRSQRPWKRSFSSGR
jgi:predicted nuclease of predicted toxin-antitoxin system